MKGFKDKIRIFASAKLPIKVTTDPVEEEVDKEPFAFMFKYGDDLRQDNLVLQMFKMMDRFWSEEGLGIEMVTYDVMETGFEIGMMQFVEKSEVISSMHKNSGFGVKYGFNQGVFKKDSVMKFFLQEII